MMQKENVTGVQILYISKVNQELLGRLMMLEKHHQPASIPARAFDKQIHVRTVLKKCAKTCQTADLVVKIIPFS